MNKPEIDISVKNLDETYKVVFEFNPTPHLLLAPDYPRFTIINVNDTYLEATGTKREVLMGKGLFEVFPVRTGHDGTYNDDQLMRSLQKVLKEKRADLMDLHEFDLHMTKSKETLGKYWNLVNRPVVKDGEVICIIHTACDVTAEMLVKKNRENEILYDKLQQEQIYELFRQAPIAVAILKGPDFEIEIANKAMCELWGKTPEMVLGQPIFQVMPSSANHGQQESINEVRESGVPYIEVEMPTLIERNGILETLYFNFIYQPLRERNGSINKILMITTEVLEQASAKTDLQKSRAHLNLALKFGNIGVWQYEYATQVTNYSDTAIKLFGQKEHQAWDREKFLMHVYEEDKPYVIERLTVAASTGTLSMNFRIENEDETFTWLSMQGKTMFDGKNNPVRMLGLISDITETKDDERRKDEFMGIVSHELKTPVTSLKAYGQILHGKFLEEGDQESADMLGKMDTQVNKLTSLIGDLLDATRIEGGQLRFHETDFNVNEMVKEIIEEVQRTSSKHRIITNLSGDVLLFGDRDRIGQVLTNLLTNAIKYSPGDKDIVVSTEVRRGNFICSVADEGLGIPSENLEKIFERYFRVQGGKRQTYPGLGLGLYISAEIIKRQDGRIWVESEEGQGSKFFFSIPLKRNLA